MRRRAAGRLQTVGAGMLVLAVTVAAPALSTAQEESAPGTLTTPATPTPSPTPPAPPDDVAKQDQGSSQQQEQQIQTQAAPTPVATDRSASTEKPNAAKLAASKTVSIGDNLFSPATVTISVGDTVTWKNDGAAPHTATADDGSFDTGQIQPGQSRSETFTTAGNVPYICTLHAGQSGTVKVLAASGGNSDGGGGSDATTGNSEAAAVASSDAAGSSTSLPATGFFAIALFAIGLALVGSGSYLKRLEQRLTSSSSS